MTKFAPPHTTTSPFFSCSGPRSSPKIAIVGEAWGTDERLTQLPFVGRAGQELTKQLSDAGITRKNCFITNVFNLQPPNNDVTTLCGSKLEMEKGYKEKPLAIGKYVLPRFLGEVERLYKELEEVKPNLILALGNTACWALVGQYGITKIRGATSMTKWGKILPTYHPSAVLRNWALRTITITDLIKAKREGEFPEIRRPERYVLINPTEEEIEEWYEEYAKNSSHLSIDIETAKGQVEMIGFASSPQNAIVIPFIKINGKDNRYWPSAEQEVRVWKWVQKFLSLPQPKVFQNGLYDLQYLLRIGLSPRNCSEDTMLLAHSLYPEMPKGLGFLGSIFTDEASWKLMRGKGHDEFKADE